MYCVLVLSSRPDSRLSPFGPVIRQVRFLTEQISPVRTHRFAVRGVPMILGGGFIPDPSLDRMPIVSGFSSGSSKLPFYYCGTGAHGSWTGHEKTTFCGCISEDRESESVFGLPTLCSISRQAGDGGRDGKEFQHWKFLKLGKQSKIITTYILTGFEQNPMLEIFVLR